MDNLLIKKLRIYRKPKGNVLALSIYLHAFDSFDSFIYGFGLQYVELSSWS